MFGLFDAFFTYSLWAAGAAAGAALAFLVATMPQARLLPRPARYLAALCGCAVASFSLGHIHGLGDNDVQVRDLQRQIVASRDRAREQSALAQVRLVQLGAAMTQVTEYEEELANGQTTTCPSDTAYDRRLRNILGGAAQ